MQIRGNGNFVFLKQQTCCYITLQFENSSIYYKKVYYFISRYKRIFLEGGKRKGKRWKEEDHFAGRKGRDSSRSPFISFASSINSPQEEGRNDDSLMISFAL